MPRTARASQAGYCYHVLNRGNGRRTVFHKDGDFAAFRKLLRQAAERVPMRLVGYCLLPNHFHLALWPVQDGDLSRYMGWLLSRVLAIFRRHPGEQLHTTKPLRSQVLTTRRRCPPPRRRAQLYGLADFETPDAGDRRTIYRVPGEGFVALAETGNADCHGWRKVLIDLENIDFLSTRALGTIITLERRLSQGGGRLVLSSSQADLHQVFVVTKLDKVLTLCHDKEEALGMFNPMPSTTDDQVIKGA